MKRTTQCILVIAIHLFFFAQTGVANPQPAVDKTLSPYFFVQQDDSSIDHFPLQETNVDVHINGVIADVIITQKYKNQGTRPIHGQYIFPASTRAAVHGMKMQIGEHIITARIQEKKQARQTFAKAKQEGKSASLLEQQRPNVFSMNVANIMPGDVITIELKYTELLVPNDKIYEFIYPTVVGPRYSNTPESKAQASEKWVKNPYLSEGTESLHRFHIDINITTPIPLQELLSPSHSIDTQWHNTASAEITLKPTSQANDNRDFILRYRLAGKEIQSGLMLYQGADENFFLLMMEPPGRINPADIPAREYIFVVDVSGSMHGFPLNTAKHLLRTLISSLKPTDMFNVVLFAGGSSTLADSSVAATQENIHRAIDLIERQRGGGGTKLLSALEKAVSLPGVEQLSRSVLIISDGYISCEKEAFQLINDNLNRTNFFAFGIGSSVNRYLMEGIAKAGQGEVFIATSKSEAQTSAAKFIEYVRSPILTDIDISFDKFKVYDVEPLAVPDMFAERPLVLLGKWRGEKQGAVKVKGISGTNKYQNSFDISTTEPLASNSALPYLWARKRIARLSDYNHELDNDEKKAQVISLGRTYNLLTAHTSFVAVHDVVRNSNGKANNVKQPLPLPKGVTNLAVGRTVPEPGLAILLSLTVLFLVLLRKRNGGKQLTGLQSSHHS